MNEKDLRSILKELDIVPIHRNRRGWLVCSCPFAEYTHEYGTDSNPSFFVKISPEGFSGMNCFTCHKHGSIVSMIQSLGSFRGHDYNDLVIKAMSLETPENFKPWEEAINKSEEVSPLDKDVFLRLFPKVKGFKDALKYLAARDISMETAEILEMRFDEDEKRIVFPVYDFDRNLFGFTGRTILPNKEWPNRMYSKVKDYAGLKKEKFILGEHLIDPDKPMLLVEGLFALATMVEIGADSFCNPVASMGSFLSEAQRDILVDYDQPVFILYDNDAGGLQGMFGAANRSGERVGGGAVDMLKGHVPTYTAVYPDGVFDPDNLNYEEVKEIVCSHANKKH
jgi:DNA primase